MRQNQILLGVIFIILKCIGSIALFVYGMKTMSEGVQKLAGKNLRDTLNKLTNNRVKSIFTGLFTTSLVQSSSAISVLAVSFIHAGIVNLRQAMGIIMGANIGTTATAILVTALGFMDFSIHALALPLVALSFPFLFGKKGWNRSFAEFLIGFSILMFSLQFLRDSFPPISNETIHQLESFTDNTFLSTIVMISAGIVLTILFQSSSATMALTLALCEQEVLSLNLAALVIIGANIGTTLTANIAAIVANVSGKRLARFHTIFNLVGAIWFVPLLGVFLALILDVFNGLALDASNGFELEKWGLVTIHVLFNILNCLLFIPLVPVFEKWLEKIVPTKSNETVTNKLEYIESGIMKTPELALLEVNREITELAKSSAANGPKVMKLLETSDRSIQEELLAEIRRHEAYTDKAEEEVTRYLSRLSEDVISNETSVRVGRLLSIINDIETIGDLYYQITKIFDRKIEKEIYFLPNQRDGLKALVQMLEEANQMMISNMQNPSNSTSNLEHAYHLETLINKKRNQLRKLHLKGIETGDFNIKSAMIFSELYTSIERIGDHILKITEAQEGII